MAFTIYCLTNTVNGKQYVGQTSNLSERLRFHQVSSSGCRAMKAAIAKYGWSSFDLSVLAYATLDRDVDLLEIQYIHDLGTLAPYGYNLRTGGSVNHQISSETRQRMSRAAKTRGVSQVCRDAQKKAVPGRKLTPEQTKNMGSAWRGKQRPEHTEFMKGFYSDPEKRVAHSERMKVWWAERRATCSP